VEVERQYSVKSAAELLDVSIDYVYARLEDGELPRRLDLGGGKAKYRIPASDLQRFIDSRTTSRKPGAVTPGQNTNL
jgi:excisionase family DNA binding protein